MVACFAGAAPQASASVTGKCQRHGHRGSAISNDSGVTGKCQRYGQRWQRHK